MTSPIALPDRRLALPNGTPVEQVQDTDSVLRSIGWATPEESRRLQMLADASYVLVRIDDVGERWRCRYCNGRHTHFTVLCTERPFRGLTHGLLAYWQNTAVPDADLAPEMRQRRANVAKALGLGMPSLAEHHPETARALKTGERDQDFGAWVLGVIDPISPAKAFQLAARINSKARQIVVRL